MSLIIQKQLDEYRFPYPKIGCGLIFGFGEDDYVVTAGQASVLDLIFNLFGAISNGDTIEVHGKTFTFVSAAPANLYEIQIGAPPATRDNFVAALAQIPFFLDNYSVSTLGSLVVNLTNNTAEADANYAFQSTTANANAIIINPFTTSQSGANAVTKQDYYVAMDITDAITGQKLCMLPFQKPLNVPGSGSPNVCFDVQPIVERYKQLYTRQPAPRNMAGLQGFDPNYIREFRLRIYNGYKDPSNLGGCDRLQSDFYDLPEDDPDPRNIRVANFLAKEDACVDNAFSPYSGQAIGNQLFISTMPEEYRLCANTALELRFDHPDATGTALGERGYLETIVTLSNGATITQTDLWTTNQDGCQIAYISFGDAPPNTIIIPSGTKPVSATVQFYVIDFVGARVNITELKQLYFGRPNNAIVNCCHNTKQFFFVSSVGNNDTIIARDYLEELEYGFLQKAGDLKCCPNDTEGINQYTGGLRDSALDTANNTKTAYIEGPIEYLKEFLLSPMKYEYDSATGSMYSIFSVSNSATLYEGDTRPVVAFKYQRSLIQRNFQL